jgi:hypothetical protein
MQLGTHTREAGVVVRLRHRRATEFPTPPSYEEKSKELLPISTSGANRHAQKAEI